MLHLGGQVNRCNMLLLDSARVHANASTSFHGSRLNGLQPGVNQPNMTENDRRVFRLKDYVRWGDVDPAGIIRWDAYTRFFELAEAEFFRDLGIPYRQIFQRFKVGLPRRVMHIDFESAPVLDEQLEVCVYVSNVGTTSMTMNFDIYGDAGVVRAAGYLVLVCVDAGGMIKRPWPPELLGLIEPFRMSTAEARDH